MHPGPRQVRHLPGAAHSRARSAARRGPSRTAPSPRAAEHARRGRCPAGALRGARGRRRAGAVGPGYARQRRRQPSRPRTRRAGRAPRSRRRSPDRRRSARRACCVLPARRCGWSVRTRRTDASAARRAAPGLRRRARCDPCADGRPGSRGPHACACAGGSRGSWPGAGCSAGRCASTRQTPRFVHRHRREDGHPRRPRAALPPQRDGDPELRIARTCAGRRDREERLCHGTRRRAHGQTAHGPSRVAWRHVAASRVDEPEPRRSTYQCDPNGLSPLRRHAVQDVPGCAALRGTRCAQAVENCVDHGRSCHTAVL